MQKLPHGTIHPVIPPHLIYGLQRTLYQKDQNQYPAVTANSLNLVLTRQTPLLSEQLDCPLTYLFWKLMGQGTSERLSSFCLYYTHCQCPKYIGRPLLYPHPQKLPRGPRVHCSSALSLATLYMYLSHR